MSFLRVSRVSTVSVVSAVRVMPWSKTQCKVPAILSLGAEKCESQLLVINILGPNTPWYITAPQSFGLKFILDHCLGSINECLGAHELKQLCLQRPLIARDFNHCASHCKRMLLSPRSAQACQQICRPLTAAPCLAERLWGWISPPYGPCF